MTHPLRLKLVLCLSFLFFVVAGIDVSAFAQDASPRERLSLDFDWKFHLGDNWGPVENLSKAGESGGPAGKHFNDASWRTVNVPHDWVVELPFDAKANYDHGYKPVGPGFHDNSVGWYRRTFNLTAADRGKKISLVFDGVYRDCRIYVNDFVLKHHESGYNSFRCDVSDVANYEGTNTVAVRVDASEFEGWFYEGAGIYRHVWLEKTGPVAIAPDGVFVYSKFNNNIPQGPAAIYVETLLKNDQASSADKVEVTQQIVAPDGKQIARAISRPAASPQKVGLLDPLGEDNVKTYFVLEPRLPLHHGNWDSTQLASPKFEPGVTPTIETVPDLELWSPEDPKLYKLITTVSVDDKIVDRKETEFGIRTVGFDTTHGFMLNGNTYTIKGTCDHQDHAGVGSAVPDALQTFRVATLKAMGSNAIRTSHNEPTAEVLDACDRLGMLVMDENRRLGSDEQNLDYLKQQILRDRNHPSVFIWSLCNEEHSHQQSDDGARVFATMQKLAHKLDPTRLCTAAMDGRVENRKADGFSSVMDVQGFNYIHRGDMDKFHAANPTIPCIGTEESSAYFTRGVYENTKTYESAYEGNKPDYGTTAEEWWKYYVARPWASGSFMWTGFDYRGEESPFRWPNINSEFGIIDTCGFPKDVYYYYQSWWTDKPVLHLMPHWTWPGKEGKDIDVQVFSNCEEVELFLNGQSLGKKSMPKNSHLKWLVKYSPGTLSAKGYTGGKLIAEEKDETTGAPAVVQLTPDRTTIQADGKDVSVVKVSVTDAQGRVVPTAGDLVHFELSGPGKIIGVGNGDPASHEPDVFLGQQPVRSAAFNDGWRYKEVADAKDNALAATTKSDDTTWKAADVKSGNGPLQENRQAVYSSRLQVSEKDLAAARIELNFGMIDDDGFIYVNGQRIGEAHVRQMPARFDIKPFLRTGDNVIAVGVVNEGGPGGISRGVTLDYQYPFVPPPWQRSVFNGLAQVIVQSAPDAGKVKLTATTDGLAPATTVIRSK